MTAGITPGSSFSSDRTAIYMYVGYVNARGEFKSKRENQYYADGSVVSGPC